MRPTHPISAGTTLLAALLPASLAASTLATPNVEMPVLRSDLTPDQNFTSGPNGTYQDSATARPDGWTERNITGAYSSSGSESTEIAYNGGTGGGTLTWSTSESLAGTLLQRVSTAAGAWSFESSWRFSSTLDYAGSARTYGNFYFVIVAENKNTLSFDRYVRILVDQPLSIRLDLAATLSKGTIFDVSSSAVLLKNPFNFTGLAFAASSSSLLDLPGHTRMASGSAGNIDYSITATADAGGIHYDLSLSPRDPSTPETLELRWFLDHDAVINDMGANRLNTSKTFSGEILESLTVTPVPEPSAIAFTLLAFSAACIHRGRRPHSPGE